MNSKVFEYNILIQGWQIYNERKLRKLRLASTKRTPLPGAAAIDGDEVDAGHRPPRAVRLHRQEMFMMVGRKSAVVAGVLTFLLAVISRG